MCVQRFDDSLSSAIHITYRILLRSSSLQEPRYPLLTVVFLLRLSLELFEVVQRRGIVLRSKFQSMKSSVMNSIDIGC